MQSADAALVAIDGQEQEEEPARQPEAADVAEAAATNPSTSSRLLPSRTAAERSPFHSPARRQLCAAERALDQHTESTFDGGAAAVALGRSCARAVARRTLADLEADTGSTGMHLPKDLPTDFPRGPWYLF